MAESTTTLRRSENWVRSMIPAWSPKSDVMVPNVSPVDMRSVVNVPCGAQYLRASG